MLALYGLSFAVSKLPILGPVVVLGFITAGLALVQAIVDIYKAREIKKKLLEQSGSDKEKVTTRALPSGMVRENQQFLSRCIASRGTVWVPFFETSQLRAAGHDRLPGIEPDTLSGKKLLCIFSSRTSAEVYVKWFSELCSQQGAQGFAWKLEEFKLIADDGLNFASQHGKLVAIARKFGASGFALDHPGTRMQPFGSIPLE